MDESPASVCRPIPKFFMEPNTFSTKKERNLTPRDKAPPPPRPSTKKTHSVSRISVKRAPTRALPVSFKTTESTMATPCYNEDNKDLYFHQCFEVICKLGSGSFGEVYKVRSKEDGMLYAIKKSRQRFKSSLDRLQKLEEVDKHEKLPLHKNCVKFIKAWEEKNHLYIQTELCKMSLSAYAEEHHNLEEEFVWGCLIDLLKGVQHLHDHNLVHMDIKPENIFISNEGVCKLGDFGLVIDLNKVVNDVQEGDPKYLAPELLKGHFGKSADVFSLGISILELASDLDLPRGEELWHRLRSGQLPEELLKGNSEELKGIIRLMMEPNHLLRPDCQTLLEHGHLKKIWEKIMLKRISAEIDNKTPTKPRFVRQFLGAQRLFAEEGSDNAVESPSMVPIASDDEDGHNAVTPRRTPNNRVQMPFHWGSFGSSTSPTSEISQDSSQQRQKDLAFNSISYGGGRSSSGDGFSDTRPFSQLNGDKPGESPERKKLLF